MEGSLTVTLLETRKLCPDSATSHLQLESAGSGQDWRQIEFKLSMETQYYSHPTVWSQYQFHLSRNVDGQLVAGTLACCDSGISHFLSVTAVAER
jgi:hypothetical protein